MHKERDGALRAVTRALHEALLRGHIDRHPPTLASLAELDRAPRRLPRCNS
jgi:hypothetical protein